MWPAGISSPIPRDTAEKIIFLLGVVRKLQRTSRFYQAVRKGCLRAGIGDLRCLSKRDREMLVVCSALCADAFPSSLILPLPGFGRVGLGILALCIITAAVTVLVAFGPPCNFLHAVLKMKPIFLLMSVKFLLIGCLCHLECDVADLDLGFVGECACLLI